MMRPRPKCGLVAGKSSGRHGFMGEIWRVIDCTRRVRLRLNLAVLAATAPQATAQSPAQSNFNIYVNWRRSAPSKSR